MTNRTIKDSGIKWIGTIPETWGVGKVKNAFIRKNEKANIINPTVLSLARKGIKVRNIENNEGQLAADYSKYNPVTKGDILLNPMDLVSGANCNISKIEGVISPAYINLKNLDNYHAGYYIYYFKLQYWSNAFFAHGKGVSYENRWTLNNETLMKYPLPIPPYQEQKKIAVFLDEKVSHIDNIIEDTQKSIGNLKNYNRSVTTEIVTEGLEPKGAMKNSGIEWIGKIPHTWEVIKLKYVLSERNIKSITGEEEPLSMSQKYGLIKTKDMDVIPNPSSTKKGNKIVNKNDLVFNKLKAHLGVFSVSKYEGIVSPDYAVYFAKKNVNIKFLEFLFKSPNYITEFKKRSRGIAAGLTRLYTSDLLAIKCALPSLEEQNRIVDFVNFKTKHVRKLIDEKESLITELEFYKKSLIYEYVTGKKEVE